MKAECGHEHHWLAELSERGIRGVVALLLLLPGAVWAGCCQQRLKIWAMPDQQC